MTAQIHRFPRKTSRPASWTEAVLLASALGVIMASLMVSAGVAYGLGWLGERGAP